MLAVQHFSICRMCGLVCKIRGRPKGDTTSVLPRWIAFLWMPEDRRDGAKTSADFRQC